MSALQELIERTSQESPAAFKDVNERTAAELLQAVFATLARDIDHAPDGAYRVSGLGIFHVRTAEANAKGKGGGRRVIFRTKQPKAPAAP
jgi:hypothetical protein